MRPGEEGMEKEVLETLEYNNIRMMISERAGSVPGKDRALYMEPATDLETAEELLKETREAVMILSESTPPLGGIRDLGNILKKATLGGTLEIQDIQDVASSMYAMRNIKLFFKELELDAPMLKAQARSIELLGQLERRIGNTIDEHGNIIDSASVELSRIRREKIAAQRGVKERLSRVLHDTGNQKFFQESIVTIRDDRYVIPVKHEYRNRFPGIVHDQSATGATLFIEPMEIVSLNNDVKELSLAEEHEIIRILRGLSQEIGRAHTSLAENMSCLADMDFVFAKAKLASDMHAIEPVLSPDHVTRLHGARHPLIPEDKAVPIDIEIGKKFTMLLITGPNTGGKTVSMKTLGLLVLMAQSGCYIPARADSEIAVYENIYADIGDEQSIEQSLSTFSAHMTNIIKILGECGKDDLLLLDELGAGTDPEEGAALAMSILERLLSLGAHVMATTHYSELKTFAYTRDGIENACVEFDTRTLKPTYRLLIGIPGASNAFAISRRLGLGKSLILRAQQLIKADHAQFESVLNELENEKLIYEQKNAEIDEKLKRAEQLAAKAEAERKELNEQRSKLIKKARTESSAIVRRARHEAEDVIKELKDQFNDYGVKKRQHAIDHSREVLDAAADRVRPVISGRAYTKKINVKKLDEGDTRYIPKLDQKGTVLSISGKDISVQLGSMKMNLKAGDCRFVSSKSKDIPAAVHSRSHGTSSLLSTTQSAMHEIDIRGMMVNEAEVVVGKFIDTAIMAGLKDVLIIHGKGTGALRAGIQTYLKRNHNVSSYMIADISEGGAGATVAKLRP